jgi:iodotyrosine deiodinase
MADRNEEVSESHRAMNDDDDGDQTTSSEDNTATAPEVPEYERIPYEFERLPRDEMIRRSAEFFELMKRRRTIRHYSQDPVPWEVMENLLKTAGTSAKIFFFFSF